MAITLNASQIDQLINYGKISPAAGALLKSKYSPQSVAIADDKARELETLDRNGAVNDPNQQSPSNSLGDEIYTEEQIRQMQADQAAQGPIVSTPPTTPPNSSSASTPAPPPHSAAYDKIDRFLTDPTSAVVNTVKSYASSAGNPPSTPAPPVKAGSSAAATAQGAPTFDAASDVIDNPRKAIGAALREEAKTPIDRSGQSPDSGGKFDLLGALIGGAPGALLTASQHTPQIPAPETKTSGESDKVVDNVPGAGGPSGRDALALYYAQMQAQQAAQGAAQGAYNKKLDAWKKNATGEFNKTTGAAQSVANQMGDKGDLLDFQGTQMGKLRTLQNMQGEIQDFQDTAARKEDNKVLEAKLGEMDRINGEFMNSKLDDNRWWSSMNTAQKIVFSIGNIIASGSTKSNTVQSTIDRDLKIQEEQLSRKKTGLDNANTIFGRYLTLFGDKDKARQAARISMKERFVSELDSMADRFAGQVGKENAQIAKKQLEKDIEQDKFKFWSMLNPAPSMPGGAGGAKLPAFDSEKAVTLGNGLIFYGADKENAHELRQTVEAHDQTIQAVRRMKELNSNPRTYIPGTAENNEYTSQVQRIRLNTDSKFLGVAKSEEGRQILNEATAVPSQYSAQTVQKLDKLAERTTSALDSKVRAANGQFVKDIYVPNQTTGIIERKAIPLPMSTGQYNAEKAGSGSEQQKPAIPGMKSGAAK